MGSEHEGYEAQCCQDPVSQPSKLITRKGSEAKDGTAHLARYSKYAITRAWSKSLNKTSVELTYGIVYLSTVRVHILSTHLLVSLSITSPETSMLNNIYIYSIAHT